jgi:hypothetical protein
VRRRALRITRQGTEVQPVIEKTAVVSGKSLLQPATAIKNSEPVQALIPVAETGMALAPLSRESYEECSREYGFVELCRSAKPKPPERESRWPWSGTNLGEIPASYLVRPPAPVRPSLPIPDLFDRLHAFVGWAVNDFRREFGWEKRSRSVTKYEALFASFQNPSPKLRNIVLGTALVQPLSEGIEISPARQKEKKPTSGQLGNETVSIAGGLFSAFQWARSGLKRAIVATANAVISL